MKSLWLRRLCSLPVKTMAVIALVSLPGIAFATVEGVPCSPEPTDMVISYGDLVTGTNCDISPAGDTDIFRFSGTAGEVVQVDVSYKAGGGVPCAQLLNPAGASMGFKCDYGGNELRVKLTVSGSHTILVTEAGNDNTVSYAVSVIRIIPPGSTSPILTYGTPRTDEVNPSGDQDLFQFPGRAGDVIRITTAYNGGGGVPCATLFGPTGTVLGFKCDYGGNQLDLTLPDSGTYTVNVSEAGNDNTVGYVITLQCFLGTCMLPSPFISKAGIFRGGLWVLDASGNGQWDGTPTDRVFDLGQAGDEAVTGDWNGDGKTKIGIFRSGLWVLDYNGNGQWDGTAGGDRVCSLGIAGDKPLVGDWNGDGKAKIGIFRNGLWLMDYNGNCQWDGVDGGDRIIFLGQTGDTPVIGRW